MDFKTIREFGAEVFFGDKEKAGGFIPSNCMTIWHLKSSFYLQNPEDDLITELDKLEIGYSALLVGEISLVQMWFKEIEGKVYPCCLYHVSDYKYVLSIFLLEGDKIKRVRTDLICPQRRLALSEGEVHHY